MTCSQDLHSSPLSVARQYWSGLQSESARQWSECWGSGSLLDLRKGPQTGELSTVWQASGQSTWSLHGFPGDLQSGQNYTIYIYILYHSTTVPQTKPLSYQHRRLALLSGPGWSRAPCSSGARPGSPGHQSRPLPLRGRGGASLGGAAGVGGTSGQVSGLSLTGESRLEGLGIYSGQRREEEPPWLSSQYKIYQNIIQYMLVLSLIKTTQ